MEVLGNEQSEKNEPFSCKNCDFACRYISDWNRHIVTRKHLTQSPQEIKGNEWQQNSVSLMNPQTFTCVNCNRNFQSSSGLWKHNKKCNNNKNIETIKEQAKSIVDKDELIMFLIKECTDYKNLLIEQQNKMFEQQTMMMKVIENGTTSHSHNTTTNSHNKAFNLQFFLNETCKDAMNITDFVESIKLQLSDLEKMGEVGYVEGISNIITTNLKALDVTQRPVHCTDKKRETMYIKDENQWEKEDDNKTKLRKAIQKIADKNIRLLPQFREKYPSYKDSSSKISDKYDKMVVEAMVCDNEKDNKIIRNISNITTIEKLMK
jgi:hypothetical protein